MLSNFTITLAFTTALSLANSVAVNWLESYVSWRKEPVKRLILTLLLSLLVSLVVILGVNFCYVVLYRGYKVAVLWEPQAVRAILFPLGVTVLFSLVMHSRSFLLKWREAAVQAEQLQKERAISQYESLRQQVNPHFLFNSLNALTSLVEENPTRAVRFIRQLSEVYRYVLDQQEQEVVPLSEELRFVEAYLYLQRTRLADSLDATLDLPPSAVLSQFWVPPLAVQLLLENAIKHNIALQQEPLRIRITLDVAARQLTVRNTLRPRRLGPEETSGLGLRNLQARYAFLTPQPLQIQPTATEFVVTLPLLEMGV